MNFSELPYCDFFKGVNPDFGQKLQISYLFVFWTKIMVDDHLVKEQALLDKKNINFTKLP